jgi:hypothetical protein
LVRLAGNQFFTSKHRSLDRAPCTQCMPIGPATTTRSAQSCSTSIGNNAEPKYIDHIRPPFLDKGGLLGRALVPSIDLHVRMPLSKGRNHIAKKPVGHRGTSPDPHATEALRGERRSICAQRPLRRFQRGSGHGPTRKCRPAARRVRLLRETCRAAEVMAWLILACSRRSPSGSVVGDARTFARG